MCVLVAQSCPTLCNPIECSPPGPSVHEILQARTLEWVATSFSKRNYRKKQSEVAQSCPTLCDPRDCSLPVSSIHGVLIQARVLEWAAFPSPKDLSVPTWFRVSQGCTILYGLHPPHFPCVFSSWWVPRCPPTYIITADCSEHLWRAQASPCT